MATKPLQPTAVMGVTDPTMIPVQEPTETQTFAPDGLQQRGVRPTSKWDMWWEHSWENAQDETESAVLMQYLGRKQEREFTGTKLTADEANKLYPGMPKPFDGPVDPVLANLSYSEFKRREAHRVWMDRGPETGLPFEFSSGFAASFFDPANQALNLATAGMFSVAKVPLKFGGILAENILQSVATEALVRKRLADEQQPKSAADSAASVAIGSAAGTALHYGIGFLASRSEVALAKTKEHITALPPGRVRATLMRFIKASESGQKFSPAAEMTRPGVTEFTSPEVDPEAGHATVEHPSERQFYLSEHRETGTPVTSSEPYGGTVVHDNPTHARNATAGENPGEHGSVRSVDIDPNSKWVPLNSDVHDPSIVPVLKAAGIEQSPPQETLKSFLMSLKAESPEAMARVVSAFQRAGISGFSDVVETPAGKSNVLHVFDTNSHSVSDPMPVNPDKIAGQSSGEVERLQAAQDAPENKKFYEPPPAKVEKLVSPEGKTVTPVELEANQARSELEVLAKNDPSIAQELKDIDSREKYDAGMAEMVRQAALQVEIGGDTLNNLRASLLEKGVAATEEDLHFISDTLNDMKAKSRDGVEFNQKVAAFMEGDITDWPTKRKQERLLNARAAARIMAATRQTGGGRKGLQDAVINLLDFLQGGGRRQGFAVNLDTHDMAAGLEVGWLKRMRTTIGEHLKVAESGLLSREITQEMAALESGLGSGTSGNKLAAEIAKVYHTLKEEMFAVKAGYSPFLEKAENYFYRQTHDRDLVSAVSKEQWTEDAAHAFGGSFGDMSEDKIVARLGEIYDEIVSGRFHRTVFDKTAGDYNLAFKIAQKRALRPDSWEKFYDYNAKYGRTNVHETMIEMIRSASRDVAVMSKFGTTPLANVQRVIDSLSKNTQLAGELRAAQDAILDAVHVQTFAFNRPAENLRAKTLQFGQKWTSLVSNGLTFLRSAPDFASTLEGVSNFDGSSYLGNFAELFHSYIKNFTKNKFEAMEAAEEFGVYSESANRNLYVELGGGAKDGKMDQLLQLHSNLTLASRDRQAKTNAVGDWISFRLAKYAKMEYKALPDYTKSSLARYGIDEKSHLLLKHGIWKDSKGREFFSADVLKSELLKRLDEPGIDPNAPPHDVLEKLPRRVDDAKNSAYNQPGNPYYKSRNHELSPRTGDAGIDLGPLPAHNPESSASVAAAAQTLFEDAGFSKLDAGTAATLHATFFDTVGKIAGKDPKALFDAYALTVQRDLMEPGVAGYLQPYTKSAGRTILASRAGIPMDKTIIHESAHFFLETLRDVKLLKDLAPEFKADMDRLYQWLDVKNDNVTVAAHERFVNSFEVFLRTNRAPTPKLEGLFATIRDWYRRAFESVRRGFSAIPVSLANAERAPQDIENFYKKLMGGQGKSELHGPLSYTPETMSPDLLFGRLQDGSVKRLPNELTDLVLKMGAIVNDHVQMATTSASSKQRSMMYGRSDINTWRGALWRAMWQFKSSTVKAHDTMMRSYYSNPNKLNGDLSKVARFVLMSAGMYTLQDQAENLIEGKTPENPANPGYALKALANSGAGSVLADTFSRELSDASSPKDFASGLLRSAIPTVTRAVDAVSTGAMVGRFAANQAFGDESAKFPGSDVGAVLTQNIPYQNVFWAKALLHSYLLNGIREEFHSGFLHSLEKRTAKTPGLGGEPQEYFMFQPSESAQWIQNLYR